MMAMLWRCYGDAIRGRTGLKMTTQTVQFSILAEGLKRLGFTSYQAYLRSSHWQDFKLRYFAHMGKPPCSVCFQPKKVDLHHRNYRRLGSERFTDVVAVCRGCHGDCHGLCRSKPATNFHIAHRVLRTTVASRVV